MSGIIHNRPQKQADRNASETAVHGTTRSLAADRPDSGVRANVVAPSH